MGICLQTIFRDYVSEQVRTLSPRPLKALKLGAFSFSLGKIRAMGKIMIFF
jgi:hypothetical protein